MSGFPSLENRSLEKKAHFPPDVYCQKNDQKEDLMSEDFVKDGFKYTKPVRDEYESCRAESKFLTTEAVWSCIHNVISAKYTCSNFQDFKKKQTTNLRETVLPVIDMYKEQVCGWFKDLAGNAPLQNISRRVPLFKDKEESLHELFFKNVPVSRAIWFINMHVIQSTAVAETAKKKPRMYQDPTTEWTSTLCRMLSRTLEQIGQDVKNCEFANAYSEWDYLFNLLIGMYDLDIADHGEVISWFVKAAESTYKSTRSQDATSDTINVSSGVSDFALKFILHYLMKFGQRFTESELLTRRLLYWCCSVFSEITFCCNITSASFNRNSLQSLLSRYRDLSSCSLHGSICISLSGLIIFLTLSCPSAAIWNPLSNETSHAYLKGSPLDFIPHSLVALPMPPGEESTSIRKCLFEVEEMIIKRSQSAEAGWPRESYRKNNSENVDHLVRLLDVLDRYEYHLVKESNPMESLFNRIFVDDNIHMDTGSIVLVLCQWAVSPYRSGIYRSIVVACLLEQLVNMFHINQTNCNIHQSQQVNLHSQPQQQQLGTNTANVNTTVSTRGATISPNFTSNNNNNTQVNSYQLLQDTLIEFLDSYTQCLPDFNGEQCMTDNDVMRNLVCLFSELIDREVFDHDNYVRHFIARGVFDTCSHPLALENTASVAATANNNIYNNYNSNTHMNTANNFSSVNSSVSTPTRIGATSSTYNNNNSRSTVNLTSFQHSVKSELSEDNDRFSMDNPDSVRSEFGPLNQQLNSSNSNELGTHTNYANKSGHLHYLIQFPIPQDDSYLHEQNQRFQLLYGSLRSRDRARNRLRKLIRDICRLFTKRTYLIDVVHGEVCKRKRSKERERDKDSCGVGNISSTGNVMNSTTSGTNTASTQCGLANSNNFINTSNSNTSTNTRSNDDAHSSIDELHEDIMHRFSNLSYYDMEYVLSQCNPVFVKMLNGSNGQHINNNNSNCNSNNYTLSADDLINTTSNPSSVGNTHSASFGNLMSTNQSNFIGNNGGVNNNSQVQAHIYMPMPNSIFLYFDLIEMSLNITCLIMTMVDTLERLKLLFENRAHFMSLYMSYICLRIVGILQRYQTVLFTMNSDIVNRLFPTLIEQVKQVKEPTQCGPFERCILTYLNDLFTSNVIVKTRFTQIYIKAHQKVSVLYRPVDPSDGLGQFDPDYATDLFQMNTIADNLNLFRYYLEDLRSNPNSRYSFVCRALIFICNAKTIEQINYLTGLCTEFTSQCNELTSEWLGSLYALLMPRKYLNGYTHLTNLIDLNQPGMYDNLSSLIGTLLSRYCFTISDFLRLVICPVMAQGLDNVTQPLKPELQPIICRTCYILHRLFTVESTISILQINTNTSHMLTPSNMDMNVSNTNSLISCDSINVDNQYPSFRISEPLLLTGALQKVTSEFLIDVLKMLIVHCDKASKDNLTTNSSKEQNSENLNAVESDFNRNTEDCVDSVNNDGCSSNNLKIGYEDDEEDDDDNANNNDDGVDVEDDDGNGDDDIYEQNGNLQRKRAKTCNQLSIRHKRKRKYLSNRKADLLNEQQIHPIVQKFLEQNILPTTMELRSMPLGALAQLVLREICTVSWVRERFQQMSPNNLIRENVLIDKNFSQSQARRLLHIICWPYDLIWTDIASTNEGLAGAMCHLLSDLNMWTLKYTEMEFRLLYAQISFSQQSEVLGCLAQSVVQGFQTQAMNWFDSNGYNNLCSDGIVDPVEGLPNFEIDSNNPIWLLPALIAKLPKPVKAQLVRVTLEMLKGIRQFLKHKNDEDKEIVLLVNSIILSHPVFFSMLQTCLQDSDPIDSLYEQIEHFVQNTKETEDRIPDNLRTRQIVQECLHLRLTLIGQKFRLIQSDSDVCTRWAILLAQLIGYRVTEPESNCALFYVVFDMLQTLVHTLAARTGLDGKHYQTVAKRIRRELSERPPSSGIEYIRPLLLLSKSSYTIFITGQSNNSMNSYSANPSNNTASKLTNTSKSYGSKFFGKFTNGSSLINSCGNTLSCNNTGNMKNHARKRGLIIHGKERFTSWELQDPSKQSNLLSFHGTIRTEGLLSRTEEQANRLLRHDHYEKMYRPPEFYMCSLFTEIDHQNEHDNEVVRSQCDTETQRQQLLVQEELESTHQTIKMESNVEGNSNYTQVTNLRNLSKSNNHSTINPASTTSIEFTNSNDKKQFTTLQHTTSCSASNVSDSTAHDNVNEDSFDLNFGDMRKNIIMTPTSTTIKLPDYARNPMECDFEFTFPSNNNNNNNVNNGSDLNRSPIKSVSRQTMLNYKGSSSLDDKLYMDNSSKPDSNNHNNDTCTDINNSTCSSTFTKTILSHGNTDLNTNSGISTSNFLFHDGKLSSNQTQLPVTTIPSSTAMLSPSTSLMRQTSLNAHFDLDNYQMCSVTQSSMNSVNQNHDNNSVRKNDVTQHLIHNSSKSNVNLNCLGNLTELSTSKGKLNANVSNVGNSCVSGKYSDNFELNTRNINTPSAHVVTKRKRGSGRRGGSNNTFNTSNINNNSSVNSCTMHRTNSSSSSGRCNNTAINSHNNNSVSLYNYSSGTGTDQSTDSIAQRCNNNSWKHNTYNLNSNELQSVPSTRGHSHLANLSGFLRNRVQQHQQQHATSITGSNSSVQFTQGYMSNFDSPGVSHQGQNFDQMVHFNSSSTTIPNIAENLNVPARRQINNNDLIDSNLPGNPNSSMNSTNTTNNSMSLCSLAQTTQHQLGPSHQNAASLQRQQPQLTQSVPNPPPYPLTNQIPSHQFLLSDSDTFMMHITDPHSLDEQLNKIVQSSNGNTATINTSNNNYDNSNNFATHLNTVQSSNARSSQRSQIYETPLMHIRQPQTDLNNLQSAVSMSSSSSRLITRPMLHHHNPPPSNTQHVQNIMRPDSRNCMSSGNNNSIIATTASTTNTNYNNTINTQQSQHVPPQFTPHYTNY